jgi:hypothetical protein
MPRAISAPPGLQIERIEALGKPAVDRSEKITGLVPLALIASGRAMLIAARNSKALAFCSRPMRIASARAFWASSSVLLTSLALVLGGAVLPEVPGGPRKF